MYFFGVVWEPIKMVYDMLLTRTPKRERREKMASSTENSQYQKEMHQALNWKCTAQMQLRTLVHF